MYDALSFCFSRVLVSLQSLKTLCAHKKAVKAPKVCDCFCPGWKVLMLTASSQRSPCTEFTHQVPFGRAPVPMEITGIFQAASFAYLEENEALWCSQCLKIWAFTTFWQQAQLCNAKLCAPKNEKGPEFRIPIARGGVWNREWEGKDSSQICLNTSVASERLSSSKSPILTSQPGSSSITSNFFFLRRVKQRGGQGERCGEAE